MTTVTDPRFMSLTTSEITKGIHSAIGNTLNAEPLLYNVRKAVAMLGISRGLLYGFMRDGRLPYVKMGNRTLFRRRDLELFVDQQVRSKPTT
jgi:excisionase family DNA binding protein